VCAGSARERALARALVSLRVHVSLQSCSAFFLSRSVYKDYQCFESDPASGQRNDKELVMQNVLITAYVADYFAVPGMA
jgi:hypothetical protein